MTDALVVWEPPEGELPNEAGLAASQRQPNATVLVVDGDGVSRRFVELALGRDASFQIETAIDGAGAFEILGHTPVHAIIAETEFPDMNGLYFFRLLSGESRLRNIPFMFLSSDTRVATRVVAFGAGVDEFLVKPCDVGELVARVKSLIGRQRRALEVMHKRGYTLAGRFSAMAFPDLVATIEMEKSSGTLSIATATAVGAVYFDGGRVVHACFGNLVGPRAFMRLMLEADAQFEFTQEPCPIVGREQTIRESVTSLVMESARVIDTERRDGIMPSAVAASAASSRASGGAAEPGPMPIEPAPTLGAGAIAQFELSIGDSFFLGDLRVYTHAELAKWTRSPGGGERLHVVLIGDMTEGVSALLALAGAPRERWVLGSLTPQPKALGLSFFMRHERLLDIVLLDVFHPRAFASALQRTPSLVLFAPPAGDFLAIGIKARVELVQLLAQLRPPAMLAVGNQALESALRSLGGIESGTRLGAAHGALGNGQSDLRALLVDGIRLCARAAADTTAVAP
jgi:DNA-binding response OmpR family regulator